MTDPIADPLNRAQRWHDTDHGPDRAPERPLRYTAPIVEPEPAGVSSCFCCCEQCDPDWEPPRPNPFWTQALQVLLARQR